VNGFLCGVCTTFIAAIVFYLLALQELGEMGRGPGVATMQQLKKMNEIQLKDPDATTARVLEEVGKLTRKDDDSARKPRVVTTKSQQPRRHSKLRRELETAIAKAERAVADAEEAQQEDDLGASERHFLASELKQMSAEARARAEAIERRGSGTIRELRVAETKAAKLRLEELKSELAKIESEEF
jgi:hypothetical protein